jgi:hypothetical protein
MATKKKTGIAIITFSCSITVVIISAIPLFEKGNVALLITVLAGSFGAGASVAHYIRDQIDLKKNRLKKEK